MSKNIKVKNGFTIIEVVLVLAIAGLIFLMVFVAFPTLQKSQFDTQRQNDITRLSTQITNYKTNNRNKVPTDWADFITKYMKAGESTFSDPDGEDYTITAVDCNPSGGECSNQPATDFAAQNHVIKIIKKARCNGETVVSATGSNNLALTYKKEGGGTICVSV